MSRKPVSSRRRSSVASRPAQLSVASAAPARAARRRSSTPRPARRSNRPRSRQLPRLPVETALNPSLPLWLRVAIGLVLLLLALVTTDVSIGVISDHDWRSPEFLWLALGSLAWSVAVLVAPGPMHFAYVFGHELTHVCFAYLCGGRAEERFRVTSRGGHVITTKTNWLISLSPYFVPFYAVIGLLAFALCALLMDPGSMAVLALHAFLGFTLTAHAGFTLRVLLRDQPDLRMNGAFFSLVIIYLVNLLLITVLLVAASPERDFAGYWKDWSDTFDAVLQFLLLVLARWVD